MPRNSLALSETTGTKIREQPEILHHSPHHASGGHRLRRRKV